MSDQEDASPTQLRTNAALAEYQLLGNYDNESSTSFAQVGAVGAAVLLWLTNEASGALAEDTFVRYLLPAVSLILLGFLVRMSGDHLIRLKLFRRRERNLQRAILQEPGGAPMIPEPTLARASGANVASPARLFGGIGGLVSYVLLAAFVYVICMREIYRLAMNGETLTSWASLVYFGTLIILGAAHVAIVFTPDRVMAFADSQKDRGASSGRVSIAKYVLPRPNDLQKFNAMMLGCLVAFITYWPTVASLGKFLTAYILFDVIFYQARYLWNDLRGLSEDAEHPAKKIRDRWAVGENASAEVRVACISIALRLGLFALLTTQPAFFPWLNSDERWLLVWSGVCVVAVAAIYETVRAKSRPPATTTANQTQATAWILSTLLIAGMAIRAMIGFYVTAPPLSAGAAAIESGTGKLLISALLTCLGIALLSVALNCITWALEACAAKDLTGQSRIDFLAKKPHIWYFGWSSGLWSRPGTELRFFAGSEEDGRSLRPFSLGDGLKTPFRITSWAILSFASIAMFTVGQLLGTNSLPAVLTTSVLIIGVSLIVMWSRVSIARSSCSRLARLGIWRLVSVSMIPVVLALVVGATLGIPLINLATIGFFTALVFASGFSVLNFSYTQASEGLIQWIYRARAQLRAWIRRCVAVILGQRASELLLESKDSSHAD